MQPYSDPYSFFELSFEKVGWFFYMVSPNATSFENLSDVPNYLIKGVPVLTLLILVEQCTLLLTGLSLLPFQEYVVDFGAGIVIVFMNLLFYPLQYLVMQYLYDNWRLFDLPPTSLVTWVLAFFLMDFGYYWIHRLHHEVNVLWAAHQIHHSSQHFHIPLATRFPVVLHLLILLALSLSALLVPPPIFMAHYYFALLFQIWLHTELIPKLGPLEWVLNTPSHHRVHHGRNARYIDKNYGGTLIVWDRLFGTFAAESDDEKVVYGLSPPVNTYGFFQLQFHHYFEIVKRVKTTPSWTDKFAVIWKGPGWQPGEPRMGDYSKILPIESPVEIFSIALPLWQLTYTMLHFGIVMIGIYFVFETSYLGNSQLTLFYATAFFVFTIASFSEIFNQSRFMEAVEISRCLSYFVYDYVVLNWPYIPRRASFTSAFVQGFILSIRLFFLMSILVWCIAWFWRRRSSRKPVIVTIEKQTYSKIQIKI